MKQKENNQPSPDVGGITVIDVSRKLKISAILANEQLQSAEEMGHLCRDSTIEGIPYFPNLFQTSCWLYAIPLEESCNGMQHDVVEVGVSQYFITLRFEENVTDLKAT